MIIGNYFLAMDFMKTLDNANPIVYEKKERRVILKTENDDTVTDEIDSREIFDLIRGTYFIYLYLCNPTVFILYYIYIYVTGIKDPEHPLTLEELNVVEEDNVIVDIASKKVEVIFTPTIEHCSLASLIGLCIQVKLLRSIPAQYKIFVSIAPGSHSTEAVVNKQLADKERVAAALENNQLLEVINQCLVDSL